MDISDAHSIVPALFDHEERTLVKESLAKLRIFAKEDEEVLRTSLVQLQVLNQTLVNAPSLHSTQELGGYTRTPQSLVQHLINTDGLVGDLDLPMKAILQRAYLLAKIQLFRGFVLALSELAQEQESVLPLALAMGEELAQSIYTQMAEDLLLALLRKPCLSSHTKRRAARQLILIWDNATLEIDDFCPLLESAWRARNRVHAGLGCLLGTTEYFNLVAENCPDHFLDFFARDGVSEAENQAFAEFLFGLTWGELETLRGEMKRQNIEIANETWVSQVLGRPLEDGCDSSKNIDPIALYRSYTRRQRAADDRIRLKKPGPRRTAESYLMIYLLNNENELATIVG